MDDLTNNGWNFTEHRDDYLPTPPPCPPSPDCPCPPPRPLPPMPPMPGCPPRPCPPDPCQNRTPNYGLPLWKASDVTSWLMQMNGAMLRIDNIMHDLALRTGINGLPDDLVTTVSKLCQDVAVLNCTVGELSNKQANQDLLMQNMNTQFSAMKTDIASLQLSITNLDTRVMTVDSANQQNRNDITLIKSDLNMLSKTVTNLSSNLTQFQNATNQTLATLQSSVDAIENWMEDPSKKNSIVYMDSDIAIEEFATETGVTLSYAAESVGATPFVRVRNIVGSIMQIEFTFGDKILMNIETLTEQQLYIKMALNDCPVTINNDIMGECGTINVEITRGSDILYKVVPYTLKIAHEQDKIIRIELYINWGQTIVNGIFQQGDIVRPQMVTIVRLFQTESNITTQALLESPEFEYTY